MDSVIATLVKEIRERLDLIEQKNNTLIRRLELLPVGPPEETEESIDNIVSLLNEKGFYDLEDIFDHFVTDLPQKERRAVRKKFVDYNGFKKASSKTIRVTCVAGMDYKDTGTPHSAFLTGEAQDTDLVYLETEDEGRGVARREGGGCFYREDSDFYQKIQGMMHTEVKKLL